MRDNRTKRIFLSKPVGVGRRGRTRLRWVDCSEMTLPPSMSKTRKLWDEYGRNGLVFLRKPGFAQDCRTTDDDIVNVYGNFTT